LDEERSDLLLLTEVNHLTGGFVSHITNTTFCSCLDLVLGSLQLSPSSRVLFASGLFLGKLSKLFGSLPFERSDTTTRYDHGLSCVCRNGCQMDFSQVDRCVNCSRSFFSFLRLNTDMQFKAIVPNEAARTAVFRQIKMQDN